MEAQNKRAPERTTDGAVLIGPVLETLVTRSTPAVTVTTRE